MMFLHCPPVYSYTEKLLVKCHKDADDTQLEDSMPHNDLPIVLNIMELCILSVKNLVLNCYATNFS